MTFEDEAGTGFSIIRLNQEDLRDLPAVELPSPEPLPPDLLERISEAKEILRKDLQASAMDADAGRTEAS